MTKRRTGKKSKIAYRLVDLSFEKNPADCTVVLEQVSTREESEERSMTDTKTFTVKRPRGAMEELMRQVCDQIVRGVHNINPGEHWTVAKIANMIHQEFPGSGAKPSVGAVAENLKRWKEIGFAIVNDKPLAFVEFTELGRSLGLEALKQKASENRKAERATVREAIREAKKAAAEKAERDAQFAEANPPLPFDNLEPSRTLAPAGAVESLSITYTPSATSS